MTFEEMWGEEALWKDLFTRLNSQVPSGLGEQGMIASVGDSLVLIQSWMMAKTLETRPLQASDALLFVAITNLNTVVGHALESMNENLIDPDLTDGEEWKG